MLKQLKDAVCASHGSLHLLHFLCQNTLTRLFAIINHYFGSYVPFWENNPFF